MPPVMFVQPLPQPKRVNGCLIALVVFIALGIFGTIVNAISPHSSTDTTTSNTQTGNITATQASTQPTPTPLTNKTALDKQVKADIANDGLQGDDIRAGYGAKKNAYVIVGLNPPLIMSQSDQLTLVQNPDPLLQGQIAWMDVLVITLDSQGLPATVGACTLHPNHAHKIDWDNTDSVTAWNDKVYQDMAPSN